MQINQAITIGNHSIQVYGSIEIPLFDAQQVIVQVLEYKQLEDCRFYKDNKTNPLFVSRIENKQASGVLPVGVWGTNQYSNTTIHLTEFGLYECLFSSNKQIAQQFRIQIMTLLSDIRIGNIKLLVERQCETTRIVQESEQTIISYITKNSELEQQLLKLQARLDQSLEEIHIYEIEINGRFYRGTAIELMRRLKQHMKKSSNPDIRRACSEGVQIKTRLIHSQKVANRHERNYIESEFIKRIPSNARMNKNMPRVRDSSKISEECKEILQQALVNPNNQSVDLTATISVNTKVNLNKIQVDDLSVIEEKQIVGKELINNQKWEVYYQKYKKFTEVLQRNPKDTQTQQDDQVKRDEYLLAKWLYKQRKGFDSLDEEQQENLLQIKLFNKEIKKINVDDFEVKLNQVKEIYQQKKQLTQGTLGSLFHWYFDYSEKIKNNDISEYQKTLFEKSGIPIHMKAEERWMIYYDQCAKIYQETGKLPVDKQVENQFNLGKWCRRQISESKDSLTQQQIDLLAKIGLVEKKNTSSKEYLFLFEQFIQNNNRLPKCCNDKNEIYLYKWLQRNQNKDKVKTLMENMRLSDHK